MPQFFLSEDAVKDGSFHLKGPEAFHITKVLRYREGQPLVLFDGKGGRFEAVIGKIHADGSLSGKVTGTLEKTAQPSVRLTLYQGLLKSSHWEWLLEKGTELGVGAFVPVKTPRTVVLLHGAEHSAAKAERWRKVVLAAAKQSGGERLPEVREPVEFRDAIKAGAQSGLTLLAWEGLSKATAGETLRGALAQARQKGGAEPIAVNLFVGPEGGFSDEEVELAESLGATVFGMGFRTLRAETAGVAASALILYELGAL